MPAAMGSTGPLTARDAGASDATWVTELLERRWGSTDVARQGRLDDAARLPGLLAEDGSLRCGLATFRREGDQTELVTLDAEPVRHGVGTFLLEALAAREAAAGARALWLVTTNDNLEALRFYQRRGLRLVSVRPGAVAESRRRKPTIPMLGRHGIEIRDEIVLELDLRPAGHEASR